MPRKWSAEIVVSAIKNLHENGEPLNTTNMLKENKPLLSMARYFFGSWSQAVEAAGFDYEKIKLKKSWKPELVISVIQDLYKKGEPLNTSHIIKTDILLFGMAQHYFGSWSQAVTEAGLNYDEIRVIRKQRYWTKNEVVQAILARVAANLSISGAVVSKEDKSLYRGAYACFGPRAWEKARIAAGLLPRDPDPKKVWNEESVRKEILRLYDDGIALDTIALRNGGHRYILAAGERVFGNWSTAIEFAGLNYEQIRKIKWRFWTSEVVLQTIQRLEAEGVRLSANATHASHPGLYAAACIKFGCWSQAVEAAGISYRKHCLVWSTKAWLRRMHPEEYQTVLNSSQKHAKTRRGI